MLLVAAVVLVPAPASARGEFDLERIAGADRYATAAALASSTHSRATTAIIATGETFPDALAGSFIAGYATAPVLLVQRSQVPQVTADALARLEVRQVVILGGPAAVSDQVASHLDVDYDVVRLQGFDRFATAANIALAVNSADIGELDGKRTAFLAYGYGFADALAAGPLANAGRFPVLLTGGSGLGSPARTALDRLDIEHVVVVGGERAVSASTISEMAAMGITSERLAGPDRYATATSIADFAIDRLDFVDDHVDLAKGADPGRPLEGFADALAGAPHAGARRSPLLLTSPSDLSDPTAAWLERHAATLISGHVLGGQGAVDDAVVAAAEAAGRSVQGELVRFDTQARQYVWVPDGAGSGAVASYTDTDTFLVDGVTVTLDAFEQALSAGDRIRRTSAGGVRHQLTNVSSESIDDRTIGNVDTSTTTFDFVNDTTGDALRGVDYAGDGHTYYAGITQLADAAAFGAELNEGDVVSIDGTRYTVANRTVTGIADEVRRTVVGAVEVVDLSIGAFGDVPVNAVDDVFRAGDEMGERYVLGSQSTTFAQFAAALDEGDTVSYARTGATETFVLVTDT